MSAKTAPAEHHQISSQFQVTNSSNCSKQMREWKTNIRNQSRRKSAISLMSHNISLSGLIITFMSQFGELVVIASHSLRMETSTGKQRQQRRRRRLSQREEEAAKSVREKKVDPVGGCCREAESFEPQLSAAALMKLDSKRRPAANKWPPSMRIIQRS